MYKVLVTGASGQVGEACEQLFATIKNYDVLALSRKELDISSRNDVNNIINGFNPDVVVNGAAMTNVDLCETQIEQAFAINALGVRNLANACEQVNAHLIHLSSDFVFDGEKKSPYSEFDATNPLSVYATSKLGGDNEALRYSKSSVLRLAWVFGKANSDFFSWVLDGVKEGKITSLISDAVSTPTYSKDIATVIDAVIKLRAYGLINVANAGEVTRLEMGQEVLKKAGVNKTLEGISSESLNRPASRPLYSALSTATLEAVTGIKMRPWQDALDDLYKEMS